LAVSLARRFAMSASAILSLLSCVVALDQNKCLVDLNSGQIRLLAGNVTRPIGLNNEGESVSDTIATAISYRDCVKYCPGGSGQEPFNWSVFSTQFAAWLLPWLALISQLPYGASDRLDNLMSMVLTVGSPTLAAYSLILTSLNNYHLAFNFSQITFPNAGHAVRILSGLQQLPLQIDLDDGLLASLVVLPKNDTWWAAMDAIVGHENAWTISALAGIVWVVVAYALTVVDSFTGLAEKESLDSQLERHSGTSDGPGVGSMWLWVRLLHANNFIDAPLTPENLASSHRRGLASSFSSARSCTIARIYERRKQTHGCGIS